MTVIIERTPWGRCRRYYDERNTIVFAEYLIAAKPDQGRTKGIPAVAESASAGGCPAENDMFARFA
jgi:hypothetical protein